MSNQPNILLITTDTQRWDTLRCMGAGKRTATWTTFMPISSAPAATRVPRPAWSPTPCRKTSLWTPFWPRRRWKLSYYFEDGRGQLFDRIVDPQEQADLYDVATPRGAAHREVRDRLLVDLLAWYGDTIDLHGLLARSHGGGPIARHAVAHLKGVSGLDAEERLNQICHEVDALQRFSV